MSGEEPGYMLRKNKVSFFLAQGKGSPEAFASIRARQF